MAAATAAVADPIDTEAETAQASVRSMEMQARNADVRALQEMANRAGLALTPAEIQSVLESHPDALATGAPDERSAEQQALLATSPAKFEVVGSSIIASTGGVFSSTTRAGGSFNNGSDVEALLNYSSSGLFGGNTAVYGRAADGDIAGYLARDGFGAIGVYGSANKVGAFLNYGVMGTTNQASGYGVYADNTSPEGEATTEGGGVALFATGAISGFYTPGGADNRDNHIVIVENNSTLDTHVLALAMPKDLGLGSADNFITFFHNQDDGSGGLEDRAVGSIQGSATGVTYNTSSADFAEWIPRLNTGEKIEAGDIVGLAAGKVSRTLDKADHVQVISTAPAFSGNDPGVKKRDQYALVAMMGQVPVKVSGVVKAGDYIVASGRNDGIGVAVSVERMTPEDYRLAVGRAWESSDEQGVKLINVAVGLGASDAYAYMRKQDQRIASLEQQLSSKMAKLDRLASRMETLARKVSYIQSANMVVKTSAE